MHIDPLTIVFALVALVTCWKLWSILGTKTGFERPKPNPAPARSTPAPTSSGVIRLPGASSGAAQADPARWAAYVEPDAHAEAGLDAIAAADPTFSASPFLGGAKSAYEAVLAAFASGDRKALQSLLAPDVYQGFDAAITERENAGARHTTAIVSLDEAKIASAALEGRMASVGVRFRSKQVSATHAADGSVTDGSADQVAEIRDLWTFSRDVKSRDPNWRLAGTAAGH